MKTREEVVAYLVAQGKHEGKARALLNEYYNWDVEGGPEGQLAEEDGPVELDEAEALEFYDNQEDMVEVTDEGIEFDGELAFDLQGNYL